MNYPADSMVVTRKDEPEIAPLSRRSSTWRSVSDLRCRGRSRLTGRIVLKVIKGRWRVGLERPLNLRIALLLILSLSAACHRDFSWIPF